MSEVLNFIRNLRFYIQTHHNMRSVYLHNKVSGTPINQFFHFRSRAADKGSKSIHHVHNSTHKIWKDFWTYFLSLYGRLRIALIFFIPQLFLIWIWGPSRLSFLSSRPESIVICLSFAPTKNILWNRMDSHLQDNVLNFQKKIDRNILPRKFLILKFLALNFLTVKISNFKFF